MNRILFSEVPFMVPRKNATKLNIGTICGTSVFDLRVKKIEKFKGRTLFLIKVGMTYDHDSVKLSYRA